MSEWKRVSRSVENRSWADQLKNSYILLYIFVCGIWSLFHFQRFLRVEAACRWFFQIQHLSFVHPSSPHHHQSGQAKTKGILVEISVTSSHLLCRHCCRQSDIRGEIWTSHTLRQSGYHFLRSVWERRQWSSPSGRCCSDCCGCISTARCSPVSHTAALCIRLLWAMVYRALNHPEWETVLEASLVIILSC